MTLPEDDARRLREHTTTAWCDLHAGDRPAIFVVYDEFAHERYEVARRGAPPVQNEVAGPIEIVVESRNG